MLLPTKSLARLCWPWLLALGWLLGACDVPAPAPAHNPSTRAGVELGRRLFYDPRLSGNNQVACATCHRQSLAFSDGVALATHGASGRALLRHAPSIANSAWAPGLFWDGGAKNLESLVFAPLGHPDEMAQNLRELPAELARQPAYPPLFQAAFGTDSITVALVARALAQFQRSILSFGARYDRYARQARWLGPQLAAQQVLLPDEQAGLLIFEAKCVSCHPAPFFTDFSYRNNGLDSSFGDGAEGLYLGRYRISGDSADLGRFKVPSLRNVALTAPYMHDGRFATLPQVLDHYAGGMKQSSTLEKNFVGNNRLGTFLSGQEKKQLLAFFNTLTDSSLLVNSALANPFGPAGPSH
jgi:cytochrome c peroxidase